MKPSITVVIPSYNEVEAIPAVLSKIAGLRTSMPEIAEVIVVDDGSTDGSAELLATYEGIRVLRNEKPQGYGSALKQGFQNSKSDLIAFLDMDDTYDIRDLKKMSELFHAENLQVVFGNRLTEANGMPWLRRFGNLFYHRSLKVMGFPKIGDPCTGMRLFRRQLTESFCQIPENDLSFSIALTLKIVTSGLRYGEIRIDYNERIGESKLNPLIDGGRFFWTILCSRFLA
jgi:glycosyltransferase involved in cell wall biosynthesis